jgi:hypothetical protein
MPGPFAKGRLAAARVRLIFQRPQRVPVEVVERSPDALTKPALMLFPITFRLRLLLLLPLCAHICFWRFVRLCTHCLKPRSTSV